MKRIGMTIALAAAVLAAAATPGVAQLNEPLHEDGWLLAAAHAPGKHGSIWRTDLWVYVRDPRSDATLTLYFAEADRDNSGGSGIDVPLTADQRVYYFEDVVAGLFGFEGRSWVGAIHYVAEHTSVQVWARVYSISPDGAKSYGQLVEGIPTADMSPDNDPWYSNEQQWMSAVKHTASGRYRVNIGIVNPTDVPSNYFVVIYNADGDRRDSFSIDVPAQSMTQVLDPFAGVDGGEWSDYIIRVECITEGGGTFAFASVVDNATNDAFFVRGVKLLEPSPPGLNRTQHDDGWILAAAHAPGLEGSIWRTDLWLSFDYPYHSKVTLYFCRSGQDGTDAEGYEIEANGGVDQFYIEDVVDHFLGVGGGSWVGAIHYVAEGSAVQTWARVYSISPDGTKSYGQLVEGIPTTDMSPDDDPYDDQQMQHLFAMKHTADDRFRVNIGAVNPTAIRAHYKLYVWDRTGQTTGTGNPVAQFNLPPYSMKQLGDPLAAVAGGEWSDLMAVLRCTTEGAGAFAFASVVDNATNDAYFVRGIKPRSFDGP